MIFTYEYEATGLHDALPKSTVLSPEERVSKFIDIYATHANNGIYLVKNKFLRYRWLPKEIGLHPHISMNNILKYKSIIIDLCVSSGHLSVIFCASSKIVKLYKEEGLYNINKSLSDDEVNDLWGDGNSMSIFMELLHHAIGASKTIIACSFSHDGEYFYLFYDMNGSNTVTNS